MDKGAGTAAFAAGRPARQCCFCGNLLCRLRAFCNRFDFVQHLGVILRALPGPLSRSLRSVHEHHGLAAIKYHAVLEVIADRACEHAALDVPALTDEILRRVPMADALEV